MERSSQGAPPLRGRPVSGNDAAVGNEYFEQFLNAASLKHIQGYYAGLVDSVHLKPNVLPLFYPKLRASLTSWRAKALWKKFDQRAGHKCYQKGKLAAGTRVLVIGGGPCGMRTAIEAQLLGAKVVVVEKRDRFSRNNVLHLWPFVIEDLRMLGAKKFFGKFCAGAIDHISIRQLQCILLKVALLLGVEVHTEVSFEKLIEPSAEQKIGWRAEFKPANHPVGQYEFDVVIGADGKRNTLQGFTRKEFRGKLAIAITANFINKKTEAEARVEEISGVAFIFNQKFFKDLMEETRIDLENIVYYKDDTHYFVMTAKKHSLIEKGVIKQDLADTEKLLAPENVDREALQNYAIEAANFSTNYQMPNLEFAYNHYGQPDIAMFDFTSMYAADNASKVLERNGYRLLMILVGDSLLEPFWPTGSGCARGFLSSLDAAWAIRSWALGTLSPLEVLAERESIYRLLAQTTPDNLNKDWKAYTLDPATRYPNLNKATVVAHQTACLFDTDNPASIERMKRNSQERPTEVPKKRRRGNVDNEVLLNWITDQLRKHEDITITDIGSIFKGGKALCAIIHHYRPDLLDYSAIKDEVPAKNNQIAFDLLEKELGIPPIMTGEEITNTEDYLTMASYLTQVYDTFRGEIPHIKHPKLKLPSKIPKILNHSKKLPESTLKKYPVREVSTQSKVKMIKPDKIEKVAKKIIRKEVNVETNKSTEIPQTDNNVESSLMILSTDNNVQKEIIKSREKPSRKMKSSPEIDMGKDKITRSKISSLNIFANKIKQKRSKFTESRSQIVDEEPVINFESADKLPKRTKSHSSKSTETRKHTKVNMNPDGDIKPETGGKNVTENKSRRKTSDHKEVRVVQKQRLSSKKKHLTVIPEGKAKNDSDNCVANPEILKDDPIISIELPEENVENTSTNEKVCSPKEFSNPIYDGVLDTIDCKEPEYEIIPDDCSKPEYDLVLEDCNKQEYDAVLDTIDSNTPEHNLDLDKFDCNKPEDDIVLDTNDLNEEHNITAESSPESTDSFSNFRQNVASSGSPSRRKRSQRIETPSQSTGTLKIRIIENKTKNKFTYQQIEFVSSMNLVTITSKTCISAETIKSASSNLEKSLNSFKTKMSTNENLKRRRRCYMPLFSPEGQYQNPADGSNKWRTRTKSSNQKPKQLGNLPGGCDFLKNLPEFKCHIKFKSKKRKFLSPNMTMSEGYGLPDQIYSRVSTWISSHDFHGQDNTKTDAEVETVISNDIPSDITSVTRTMARKKSDYEDIVVEERTDVVRCCECESPVSSEENFAEMMKNLNLPNKAVRNISKFSQYSPFQSGNLKSVSAPPTQFSVIVEGEESDLPESNKRSELSFKTIRTAAMQPAAQPARPTSRHKRHAADAVPAPHKPAGSERRARKRRTLERVGASVMFSFFLHAFLETGLVAILLFVLDIVINSEQYGYQNYIFGAD